MKRRRRRTEDPAHEPAGAVLEESGTGPVSGIRVALAPRPADAAAPPEGVMPPRPVRADRPPIGRAGGTLVGRRCRCLTWPVDGLGALAAPVRSRCPPSKTSPTGPCRIPGGACPNRWRRPPPVTKTMANMVASDTGKCAPGRTARAGRLAVACAASSGQRGVLGRRGARRVCDGWNREVGRSVVAIEVGDRRYYRGPGRFFPANVIFFLRCGFVARIWGIIRRPCATMTSSDSSPSTLQRLCLRDVRTGDPLAVAEEIVGDLVRARGPRRAVLRSQQGQ